MLTATALGVAYVAGHGFLGLLAVLLYCWASAMATSTTNTAKTRANTATLAQVTARVNTLETGTFNNVNGNGTVSQMQSAAPGTYVLHIGSLANFDQGGTNTRFLAGLSAGGALSLAPSGSASPDGFSGPSWGAGERNFVNGLWAAVAGINNYLNGHGFT
jgi:hypothetical protein